MAELDKTEEQSESELMDAFSDVLSAAKRELNAMQDLSGLEEEAEELAASVEMIEENATPVDAEALSEYMEFTYYDGALDTASAETKEAERHLREQAGKTPKSEHS